MKNKNKLIAIICFVFGILFFTYALISKNYVFVPIACCTVIFGPKYNNKKADDKSTIAVK